MAKLTKLEKELLKSTLTLLETAAYVRVDASEVKPLVDAGHLISNPNGPGEDGQIEVALPTLLTDAAMPVEVASVGYAIEAGIPVPERKKRAGGHKGEVYPFSKLDVGQSFFVASTVKKADPAKSLRGTISTAIRRFATVSDTVTRKNRKGEIVPALVATKRFEAFAVVAGQTYSNGFSEKADGARVYRTA